MIHVVVGPPASGKSTYVDEHAAENEVKVDFDRIAQAFGSGIPHGSVEPFRTVAFAARSAAIRRILDENIDAWIIHSRPSVEQVEAYERADAEFILVDPGIDQCLEQAADDDRPEAQSRPFATGTTIHRTCQPEKTSTRNTRRTA